MPHQQASDTITRLTAAQTLDTGRAAGDPFKLPTSLRTDLNADLAELAAREMDVAPKEGLRAGASAARRAALAELQRQHRGGYRGIQALDESTITEGERLQVYEAYGWESGEIGDFDDFRTIGLARLAPTVAAAEVGGVAGRLYGAPRLGRIAAQLTIIDALESTAGGADRELATLRRDTALELASMTLLRVRFFYCSATRDGDQTPELVRIGYQPRRGPGEGGGEGPPPDPLELPSALENLTLETGAVGSGTVAASCDPPPAGEQVTLYRVFSAEGQIVASGPALPLTVGGFTQGTEVTLTIRAVNATGEGPASAPASGTAG